MKSFSARPPSSLPCSRSSGSTVVIHTCPNPGNKLQKWGVDLFPLLTKQKRKHTSTSKLRAETANLIPAISTTGLPEMRLSAEEHGTLEFCFFRTSQRNTEFSRKKIKKEKRRKKKFPKRLSYPRKKLELTVQYGLLQEPLLYGYGRLGKGLHKEVKCELIKMQIAHKGC